MVGKGDPWGRSEDHFDLGKIPPISISHLIYLKNYTNQISKTQYGSRKVYRL